MKTELVCKEPSARKDPYRLRILETRDCAVVAFAEVTGKPYEVAHNLCRITAERSPRSGTKTQRILGWGFSQFSPTTARSVRPVSVLGHTFTPIQLRHHREVKDRLEMGDYKPKGEKRPMETVGSFVKRFPSGVFFCLIAGHAFAIRDGVIYDANGTGPRARLKQVWRVTPEGPGGRVLEVSTCKTTEEPLP